MSRKKVLIRFGLPLALAAAAPLLFATVVFFAMRPPLNTAYPDHGKELPPAIVQNMREHYRLNESMGTQFARFIKGVALFDLGPSTRFRDFSARELVLGGLPNELWVPGALIGLTAALLFSGRKPRDRHERWPSITSLCLFLVNVLLRPATPYSALLAILQLVLVALILARDCEPRWLGAGAVFCFLLQTPLLTSILFEQGLVRVFLSALRHRDYGVFFAAPYVVVVMASITTLLLHYLRLIREELLPPAT